MGLTGFIRCHIQCQCYQSIGTVRTGDKLAQLFIGLLLCSVLKSLLDRAGTHTGNEATQTGVGNSDCHFLDSIAIVTAVFLQQFRPVGLALHDDTIGDDIGKFSGSFLTQFDATLNQGIFRKLHQSLRRLEADQIFNGVFLKHPLCSTCCHGAKHNLFHACTLAVKIGRFGGCRTHGHNCLVCLASDSCTHQGIHHGHTCLVSIAKREAQSGERNAAGGFINLLCGIVSDIITGTQQ